MIFFTVAAAVARLFQINQWSVACMVYMTAGLISSLAIVEQKKMAHLIISGLRQTISLFIHLIVHGHTTHNSPRPAQMSARQKRRSKTWERKKCETESSENESMFYQVEAKVLDEVPWHYNVARNACYSFNQGKLFSSLENGNEKQK